MDFISLNSGSTVEEQEIKAFRSTLKSSKYIYLMAGVHGDEVEGVYVLEQIYQWLKNDTSYNLPTILIPTLNVDGLRQNSRVNAHGVDLNRNLPSKNWTPDARGTKYHPGNNPLSEPENIFLTNLFEQFTPQLIISLHSWKPFINYNSDCKTIALEFQKYNKYAVCGDIEGHPTPGSLGEYAPEKYNSPVITFECPILNDKNSLKDIWQENEEAFKKTLTSDTLKQFLNS